MFDSPDGINNGKAGICRVFLRWFYYNSRSSGRALRRFTIVKISEMVFFFFAALLLGLSEPEGQGAGGGMDNRMPPSYFDQLTITQPEEGADYSHYITVRPPDFQTFLRPCCLLAGLLLLPPICCHANQSLCTRHSVSAFLHKKFCIFTWFRNTKSSQEHIILSLLV